MCPTRHFAYIFFNPVFQVSTAKNEINLFNNHILIEARVTFAPAGAMTPSAEFLFIILVFTLSFWTSRPEQCLQELDQMLQIVLSDRDLHCLPLIQQMFRHIISQMSILR